MKPQMVVDYRNVVGEGPLWHPAEKKLYWIDIMTGRIMRYDPVSGEHCQFFEGPIVGGFTMQADGSFLLFLEGPAVAELRDGELHYLIDRLPEGEDYRFNDIIADPAGRVFCGTMPTDSDRAVNDGLLGRLYRLDVDGSIRVVVDDVKLSNGLGFTPDRKQMYYTDSLAYRILIYDYDEHTGEISNERVFKEAPKDGGVPDGMTVDAEGCVWSASAGGSALYRYTPDGEEDRKVDFPTAKIISSVTFGGECMDEIYVTTIGGDTKDVNGKDSGALFRLKPGVKGVADFYSRVGL